MESQNKTTTVTADQASVAAVPSIPKISMLELLQAGWKFTVDRKDLVTWYIILLSLLTAVSSPLLLEQSELTAFVALLALFVIFIFMALNAWSIIFAVAQPDPGQVSYKQAFSWASSNFFPLLWTSLLTVLAVLVGFMLLIIPGIILSISLYFALYAQAQGVRRGLPALKASHAVVKGQWWHTAWKLTVLGFYVTIFYIIAGIFYGVLYVVAAENQLMILVLDVLLQGIIGGLVGVTTMYALARYFDFLKIRQTALKTTQEG